MKMKMVLFDFDGVIVDTFAFCYRITNAHDPLTQEEYRARFEGNINDAKSASRNHINPFDFFAEYAPELRLSDPKEGMCEVIHDLEERYSLFIISSTNGQPIRQFLELHGLLSAFKEILGNDVEKSKEKKILSVLQRYKLKPEEVVFVTDTVGDIAEARRCGVRSIAVTWGYHPTSTLLQANPYRIVSYPREIMEVIESMG